MSMTRGANVEERMLRGIPDPQQFLRLGLMYSTGETVPTDMVAAHKWFNIAGMRGCSEAVQHRCEIAEEMSSAEIAAAQRAARDWLTRH
jgi:TPR repeat protein